MMSVAPKLPLYINGEWVETDSEFDSINPFDNSLLWKAHAASKQNVDDVMESANKAFGTWSQLTLEARKDYLFKFTKVLETHQDELALMISQENGKPLWESKTEVGAMLRKTQISLEALEARRQDSSGAVGEAEQSLRYKPHGVILVLGPFNLPAHLPNGHIVPALLAGNTVVFKPSELTPGIGHFMARMWAECDLPNGVFNLVQGDGEIGKTLIEHPLVNGVCFTGSSKVGCAIHRYFGGRPEVILALEMGGNNPLIVCDVNDLRTAIYWIIQSAFITAGQRCVCARRLILIDNAEGLGLIKELQAAIPKILLGGYQNKPEAFVGPVISALAAERIMAAQKDLISKNATPLLPMQIDSRSQALIRPGLLDVSQMPKREDEEVFGPLLQVIRVPDFDAAIQEANNTQYGLAAGLLSDSDSNYATFFARARAGIVNWNRPLTGAASNAPFGGVGRSGNHRPSAFFAADYCSYPIASLNQKRMTLPEQQSPGLNI
ncbi:MAG: succinylglutamic semialdehyde dehydrogenase [Candidatus Omnitrophota bacterium]|jgi:succinylglutamic semialdehyde dehydrogenase